MNFLLKNSFFREVHFCSGIAITNEIIHKQFFHAERLYIVNDIYNNIKVGLSLCVSNMQVHAPTCMS